MPCRRWACIHQAAYNGDVVAIHMLLKAGADCRLANRDGHTAAAIAHSQGHTKAAQLLRGTAAPSPRDQVRGEHTWRRMLRRVVGGRWFRVIGEVLTH